MDGVFVKARTRSLLEHFAAITDARPQWKVAYPLPEIVLLVVSATIASCDDYDDIVAWGEAHLDFLRRFSPYHHGIPCTDWLRVLMNRIDPDLFSACFMSWARDLRPDAADLIAIDGKTSRRSHDRSRGKAALHLVSAFATTHNLVLGQEAVADKSCESQAIPELLARLALNGALVTIDAIACNPTIARAITDAGGDYLLAVKGNQPTLQREIERYFVDAPAAEIDITSETDKGHGRIETRRHVVSHTIDWLSGDRRYPDEPRFATLTAIAMVEATVESKGQTSTARRYYISSAPLTALRFAQAVRLRWGIENRLHWVLDVAFKEDQSRLRAGHGAKNMAVVRHFAINIVRRAQDRRSIKTRRKLAGWDPEYLASLLNPQPR
jgi:predicted transposase YbfD/YdcC